MYTRPFPFYISNQMCTLLSDETVVPVWLRPLIIFIFKICLSSMYFFKVCCPSQYGTQMFLTHIAVQLVPFSLSRFVATPLETLCSLSLVEGWRSSVASFREPLERWWALCVSLHIHIYSLFKCYLYDLLEEPLRVQSPFFEKLCCTNCLQWKSLLPCHLQLEYYISFLGSQIKQLTVYKVTFAIHLSVHAR